MEERTIKPKSVAAFFKQVIVDSPQKNFTFKTLSNQIGNEGVVTTIKYLLKYSELESEDILVLENVFEDFKNKRKEQLKKDLQKKMEFLQKQLEELE